MRTYLLRFLFVATLTACSIMSYGQKPTSNTLEPLYIINSNIIANGLIPLLNPKEYSNIIVYKDNDAPTPLKNLSSSGIISITYEKPINSKSFAQIGLELGLHGPLGFVINGNRLDASQVANLRIAPEAIGQLHVTPAISTASEAVVNIQTAVSKTTSQKNSRGTVMIR